MEILRFEDAEKSAPNRKKSARGMFIVGLVATLFGVGTAFASTTITINSDQPIDVGQGVSEITRCDDAVNIAANSSVYTPGKSAKPKFYFSGVTFSGVNQNAHSTIDGSGCGGEVFDFQIWKKNSTSDDSAVATAYTCGQLGLQNKSDNPSETSENDLLHGDESNYVASAVTCSNSVVSITVPVSATLVGTFKVPFGRYNTPAKDQSLDISYFTLSSRTPTVS